MNMVEILSSNTARESPLGGLRRRMDSRLASPLRRSDPLEARRGEAKTLAAPLATIFLKNRVLRHSIVN